MNMKIRNLLSASFRFISVFVLIALVSVCSCGDDESTNPTPPVQGKVLLATVTGDSVGASAGASTKISSISGQELDFTDRDSAEITFTYAGTSNNLTTPLDIYYEMDTLDISIYNPTNLNLSSSEQSITVTLASPKVKKYFYYKIRAYTNGGLCYFKFRDMKIYKK